MHWALCLALGSFVAAVSTDVLVPCVLKLKAQGYGEDKGVSTVIFAATSLDDVLAICFYGIFLGLGLSGAKEGHILLGDAE